MATATTPPNVTPANPGYDQFVDSRIAKTRTAVKTADVATGVVALIAWALVVLLVSAVADHWIVSGGLDRWERYALWAVGLAGAGLYIVTRLGPNLWRSVNPLYAARELERETPELKNSLLNLLQLRGAGESAAIKQTLERQAAERLVKAGDAPIDHTPLVRAAKVLLALVAMVGVYVVASPKDFFASAGRVLAPWSQIAAPSRVRITAIEPGAVTLAQGARLNVTAKVSGLNADELVELVYTSDDRQAVGRRVPMTASRGGGQFSGSLPTGSGATSALGLQSSLTYRIEAGDAHSASYHVEVLTAPTIAPIMVRYDYPPYTGLKAREVDGVGDLRAIDGTRVTLSVEANLPIESAQIDVGADGRPDVRMTVEGSKATGAITLRHDGSGVTSTNNYVLRFTSTDGQANNDPPQYQIEVVRDYAPEVSIREPEAESIDVALNQRVRVVAEARDPDYALKRVRLVGETSGEQILEVDLLRGDGKGGFTGETEVVPQAIGLRPGDVLDYWVEATDNRMPQPNVSISERRQLRVMASNDPQQGDRRDGEQQQDAGGDPRQDEQQGDPNGEGQNGEQQQDGGAGEPNQGQLDQDQPDQGQQGENSESGEEGQKGGQSKSQADEKEGQQGENGQPPPGGLSGPGNEGGGESSDQSSDGNEGSSSSKPNDGENSPAGGSQAGEQNGDQRQQPSDNQNGESGQNGRNGGDPQSGNKSPSNNRSQGNQPQGGESSGDNKSDGQGAGENPVARDGSDDGSAFDKMLDWMKQQQGDKQNGNPSQSNQQQTSDKPSEGNESGEKAQQDKGEPSKTGDQQQNGQPGESQEESSNSDGSPQEGGQQQGNQSDGAQDAQSDPNGQQGEQGQSSQGSAAGKQESREQQGGKQPDRNEQQRGAGEFDRSGDQSASKSSQSGGDTPPGESTDRNAGPREGAEGAGQSQAADRGAGQSSDKGAGDSSGRAGGEEASDSPTGGESGNERGNGSKSRESQNRREREARNKEVQQGAGDKQQGNQQQGGKQQNGQSQQGQSGESAKGSEGQSGQNSDDGSQQSGDAKQQSEQQNSLDDERGKGARDSRNPVGTGGGPMELADRGATSDDAGDGAESGGDAANLDYARKQTELVLQRLDEQLRKKEVDRKLLDKLGWTEEDLQEFVDRWQSRKQKAAQQGAEGEAELDRALKSLGLNSNGPRAKSNVTEDSFRDLRENARAKTPPRLREQVESYLRSINATDSTPAGQE